LISLHDSKKPWIATSTPITTSAWKATDTHSASLLYGQMGCSQRQPLRTNSPIALQSRQRTCKAGGFPVNIFLLLYLTIVVKLASVSHSYHSCGPATQPLRTCIQQLIESPSIRGQDPKNAPERFYVIDKQSLQDSVDNWKTLFPGVQAFYAVKCNPDVGILRQFASNDLSFDCASSSEIAKVLEIGVHPSRILYANPCKSLRDLAYAYENGILRTTVDSLSEIEKTAKNAPGMECLVRIFANDPKAQCVLSNKFGAPPEEWEDLLDAAKEHNIHVVGVSFHVGSGAQSPNAYRTAIKQAHVFAKLAEMHGFVDCKIIDIGGGFARFRDQTGPIADDVMEALTECFPVNEGYQWIAEPGRFMVEHSSTLVTQVIGRKIERSHIAYTVADGLYGSFNCMVYDHTLPIVRTIYDSLKPKKPSTLYGPTCDGFDTIAKDVELPELEVGDWVMFPDMGAYTLAGASCFNGIPFYQSVSFYV